MTKRITSIKAIAGKTIKATFESDERLIIVFTDSSYVALQSETAYNGDKYSPQVDSDFEIGYDAQAQHFVVHGLMTAAQYEEWLGIKNGLESRRQQEVERRELQQLAQLKAKYERA